ncbi:MAG: hypothetical protein KKE30_17190 [Gammaproteobacteria bacterium]|nr:hypothetical protein [Gammaproteobacteria bacterium]MBU1554244.1 hypothetical protein [Gammaproteobacteria bacterium]MBU2072705.1 hypothetical protein [Gammaproteobacteria bacterium]MBU2182161.1 hypothetical protein [Gammaproteobacteria bacterium]MBU2204775.1 hypothetical protein [Gammaproteobacteria bacterium]
MPKNLDVLALSHEVERDSASGKLTHELLSAGQTLYGKNPDYPDFIERVTPDNRRSLGYWRDRQFVEIISLL